MSLIVCNRIGNERDLSNAQKLEIEEEKTTSTRRSISFMHGLSPMRIEI